jgi:hypothetical protein
MMKKLFYILFALVILSACKKDQLTVSENKIYSEVSAISTNPNDGGMYVALEPSGNASFALGGDAIQPATYKINGSTLKVYWNDETYKIKIISENELNYNGKILRLKER